MDSQSVASTGVGGPGRGYDGGKHVKGRKRHIVTDTMGLLLAVLVHSASIHDSQRLPHLLKRLLGKVPRLKVIFADQGYEGAPGGFSGDASAGFCIWLSVKTVSGGLASKRNGGS